MKFIFSLVFLLNVSILNANPQSVIWYTHGPGEEVNINVDLFMSSTCPHCIKADAFFREVEKKKPWLIVHRYVINQDKLALQTFYDRIQEQNLTGFSVPAIFFCGSRWSGFSDANTTGKALLHALTYCRKKISEQGELSPVTMNILQKGGNASQYHYTDNMAQSTIKLTLIVALMDTVSSCSLFCFAAFLAFLWLYPAQKWMQFGLGLVFILSLGVMHYVQQGHTPFYYQMIPHLKLPEMLVGIALLLTVLNTYRKMKSQVALHPSPLVFAVVVFTVFAIQIYQQTCVFNAAFILEQWWVDHPLSPAKHMFYQVIYQVFYVLPLAILLLFFLVFGRHRRLTSFQQALAIAGSLILLSIGLILVVYPQLLANLLLSMAVLPASIFVGWLINNRSRDE